MTKSPQQVKLCAIIVKWLEVNSQNSTARLGILPMSTSSISSVTSSISSLSSWCVSQARTSSSFFRSPIHRKQKRGMLKS